MREIECYKYKGYYFNAGTKVGVWEIMDQQKFIIAYVSTVSDVILFIDRLVSTELELVLKEVVVEAPVQE